MQVTQMRLIDKRDMVIGRSGVYSTSRFFHIGGGGSDNPPQPTGGPAAPQ